MTDLVLGGEDVAKKKADGQPKRYGTLIRVSDELAQAIREITRLEGISMAEFGDAHILPMVRKRYRAVLLQKARRIEGKDS